jgi:hypothetical protein
MKFLHPVFCLLALAAGTASAAEIIAQEFTVMTGLTESTVGGQLQIVPAAGESGAIVQIPVLLPRQAALNPATAYAATQPSLAVGPQNFLPVGFHIREERVRGLPRGWQVGIFQFQIPPEYARSGFIGKVMYVQPQNKDVTPFVSLASQAAPASSKITFLPGNSYSIGLLSKNTQPSTIENGMLSLRPVNEELILVGRKALKESRQLGDEKPQKSRTSWKNPLEGLLFWRKKTPQPEPAPPQPILPPQPQ